MGREATGSNSGPHNYSSSPYCNASPRRRFQPRGKIPTFLTAHAVRSGRCFIEPLHNMYHLLTLEQPAGRRIMQTTMLHRIGPPEGDTDYRGPAWSPGHDNAKRRKTRLQLCKLSLAPSLSGSGVARTFFEREEHNGFLAILFPSDPSRSL